MKKQQLASSKTNYSKELKNYYESIIACMPSNVYWLDRNCALLGGNDNLAKLFGLRSRSELVGLTYKQMAKLANWTEGQEEVFKQKDIDVMTSGIPRLNVEEPPVIVDGKTRYYISSKVPLYDMGGEIVGVIGISTDITERKQSEIELREAKEEADAANRSRIEFLSTVTHEIRNPVGNISTYDHFLKEDLKKFKELFYKEIIGDLTQRKKDKTIAEYEKLFNKIVESVDTINSETLKALEYLKSVGELHRLQHEGIEPDYMSIKIQELIEGVMEDTAQYNTENVEVITSIDSKVPDMVKIDYFNVSDALRIIFSNAFRFSHAKGMVKFDIGADKKQLKLIVQNFGQAISEEQIHALLGSKKDKKSESKTAVYRKPSLRLTQAKMQLEASGGKLDIQSKGNSTIVTLYVPYSLDTAVSSRKPRETKKGSVSPKRNVLVVEDDVNFQKTEKRIIEELGHTCTFVSTGKEALNHLSKNKYDLVLLDITLPDMTGVEVIEKIRKKKKTLPIVVVTSHAHKKDIDLFEELGATHVLTKPLSRTDFKVCLEFDFDTNEDDD